MSKRFDADYILNKLYEFDDLLGGKLKLEMEEELRADKFYKKRDEIKEYLEDTNK